MLGLLFGGSNTEGPTDCAGASFCREEEAL